MDILASVLLLTYNNEKYIGQAIQSVVSQKTNFNFEILIGNDCSTDATGQIIQQFALKYPGRVKDFTHTQNIGGLKNEKLLLENAKGKYIYILEGDDFWTDPLKMQKQVDFLEANPEYGMAHSDVDLYYENTGETIPHVNKTKSVIVPEGDIFNELIKPQPIFIKTATVCFRKELAKYFDYDLAIKENWPLTDLPLWMDITSHSKAHYFNEVFATYRLLNESASRIPSPQKKLQYHNSLYRIKCHYIKKYNCTAKIQANIDEEYNRGLIHIAYNLNDYLLASNSLKFLVNNKVKITLKERLMVSATKNKLLRKAVNLLRNSK